MINFYQYHNAKLDNNDRKEYIGLAQSCKILRTIFGEAMFPYTKDAEKHMRKYRLDL